MKYLPLLLLLVGISGCNNRPFEKTGLEGRVMPSFNLLLMDSINLLNTNNIPVGQPTVLLFLTPGCPFCRAQTQEIIDNIKSLNNIRFYILSSFSFAQIKSYYDHYQLNKYPNITVGQDYKSRFSTYFHAIEVPYIAIYNKNKRLKQVFVGKVSTEVIKNIALE